MYPSSSRGIVFSFPQEQVCVNCSVDLKRYILLPLAILLSLMLTACFSPAIYLGGKPLFESDMQLHKRALFPIGHRTGSCLGSNFSGDQILLIPIQGAISDGGYLDDSSVSPAYITRVLHKARQDNNIRAIILRVNSPGGTVTASDLIYRQIKEFSKSQDIPVYTHITNLGASGGYYIAMSSMHINARPTALVGSIGVIWRMFTLGGLIQKFGIKYQPIASGSNKDSGTMFKDLSDNDRALFQRHVDRSYARFLEIVSMGRGKRIPAQKLKSLADGRIYDAQEAKELGIIDSISYFDEFVQTVARKESIQEPIVVAYLPAYSPARTTHELDMHTSSKLEMQIAALKHLSGRRLHYLWEPGL